VFPLHCVAPFWHVLVHEAHDADSAGFPVVVPQLKESVHVLVCVPPEHADHGLHDHEGVQQ
jgi:hypothetical protein